MNRIYDRAGRRRFLGVALALPLASIGAASGQTLPLTPACGEQPQRTPSQTPGTFYSPASPRRRSLGEPGSRAYGIYRRELEMQVGRMRGQREARFDFVVPV